LSHSSERLVVAAGGEVVSFVRNVGGAAEVGFSLPSVSARRSKPPILAHNAFEAEQIAKRKTGEQPRSTTEESGGFLVRFTSGRNVFVPGLNASTTVGGEPQIDVGWDPYGWY
jgi:hypothetical protein